MSIELYYAPSTCALAPYITLTEAGADFEVKRLNFRAGQNRTDEYMKLNPKHKVPLLVVDGQALSENVAIQLWIARRFPEANLLPADPWDELKAVSIMSWCASGIHPYLSRINSPAKVCDVADPEESVSRLGARVSGRGVWDRRRPAGGARVLFRSLHGAGRSFLLVRPPQHAV